MTARALPLAPRPRTRGDCEAGARPCPFVSCRFHLLLDVAEDGRLYKHHPFNESSADSIAAALLRMEDTCALDVANRGESDLVEIGRLLNMTKQSVEMTQARALARIRDGAHEPTEKEHPDDPYLRYMDADKDELAELMAELRRRTKGRYTDDDQS